MAKKDKNKENKVSTDESTGSKIVTMLIVLVIVVIWLAIFGVLIKLDVGNFGSEVLYPVLKDRIFQKENPRGPIAQLVRAHA